MKNKSNPAKPCVCDLCGKEAVSIPTKQHRRCGGNRGASIKPRDKKLDGANRGTWQEM